MRLRTSGVFPYVNAVWVGRLQRERLPLPRVHDHDGPGGPVRGKGGTVLKAADRDAKVAAAVARDLEKTPGQIQAEKMYAHLKRRVDRFNARGLGRPLLCEKRCGTGKPVRAVIIQDGPESEPRVTYVCDTCEARINVKKAIDVEKARTIDPAALDPIGFAVASSMARRALGIIGIAAR